ncbi:hypothetical protein HanIR_Chr15g0736601 [Helianthus annuus]|nr:hypothetical protein HanIR_Chr15g0736601 [Helianthus annuus]
MYLIRVSWCKVVSIYVFSLKDLLEQHKAINESKKVKKAFNGIVQTTFWCLWKSRNTTILNKQAIVIIQEVKVISFLWVKSQAGASALTWEIWRRFDLSCMG